MNQIATLVKPTAPKANAIVNKAVGKSLPSVKPMQLAAEMVQQPSIIGHLPDALSEKDSSGSSLQLKSSAGIFSNNQPIQRKSASTWAYQLKSTVGNSTADPAIQLASANKTGLPDNLRSGVEQLSGISLNDVKVHYNSNKPAQLQAHAYAQGTDIHIGPGQEKHMPHEAWHVVQQKQGRVQATTQLKATIPINDDAGLEQEADLMGAKALQMKGIPENTQPSTTNHNVTQLLNKDGEEDIDESANEREAITFEDLDLDEQLDVSVAGGKKAIEGFSGMKPAPLFHTVTWFQHAKGVMYDISDKFDNAASRFGGGFYASTDMETNLLEIEHHKYDDPKAPRYPSVTIIFENVLSDKILDCSHGQLQKLVQSNDAALKQKCLEFGYDGIYFKSLRGPGYNIVLFTENRKQIMGPGKDFFKHMTKVPQEESKSHEDTNGIHITESINL